MQAVKCHWGQNKGKGKQKKETVRKGEAEKQQSVNSVIERASIEDLYTLPTV